MSAKSMVLALCVGWFGAAGWLAADDPAPKPAPKPPEQPKDDAKGSFWMEQKLEYSKRLMEGLARADFDSLVANGRAMHGLTQIEGFARGRVEGYRDHLRAFQFANEELIRHAEKDNLEGATLAFTQMTVSCVNCHNLIRKPAGAAVKP